MRWYSRLMAEEPVEPAPGAVARPLKKYDYYLGAKAIGDLWSISRGALTMRCGVSTHRLGWELRLTSSSSFSRAQICKAETEVFSTADLWLAEAKSKGWS